MTKYKEYKSKINIVAEIIFDGICVDIDNIINYAENSQGQVDLQNILDKVILDLKELRKELE